MWLSLWFGWFPKYHLFRKQNVVPGGAQVWVGKWHNSRKFTIYQTLKWVCLTQRTVLPVKVTSDLSRFIHAKELSILPWSPLVRKEWQVFLFSLENRENWAPLEWRFSDTWEYWLLNFTFLGDMVYCCPISEWSAEIVSVPTEVFWEAVSEQSYIPLRKKMVGSKVFSCFPAHPPVLGGSWSWICSPAFVSMNYAP